MGINPGRVKIIWCAASEGEILAKEVRKFVSELKEMGPAGSELAALRLPKPVGGGS